MEVVGGGLGLRMRLSQMADAPLLGIEVVGTGANVVDEAQRMPLVGDDDISPRRLYAECLVAQIAKCLLTREGALRKSGCRGGLHGKDMLWNILGAFLHIGCPREMADMFQMMP